MKKKIFLMIFAAVMITSVVACGGSDTDKTDSVSQSQESSEQQEKEKKEQITFEKMTVVDNEECTIKINEIKPNSIWGYTLEVELENKSADKTYMFAVNNASVNGVQCDPLFADSVAPGKKSNEEITFFDETLEENGIGDFTDIEISLRVYDDNDWEAEDIASETVHIYPYGEDKATTFVRESQDSDNVIVDNEYVTAIITGYEEDDIWGYTANLFLVNKTDKEIMFSVDETSINGYMMDPFWADSVSAGKCAFTSISWSDDNLEENGISEVENIEFIFSASDNEDWTADDLVNEKVVLNP